MAEEQKLPDPEAPLLAKHVPTIVRSLVEALGAYGNARLDAAVAPLLERIAALEAAIPTYVGIHDPTREYRVGEITTHSGSMWICLAPTMSTPPSDFWRCCVKRGRDGRDRFIEQPPQRMQ